MEQLASYDNYWKMETCSGTTMVSLREKLERRGYQPKKSAAKSKLMMLKHRKDCGLIVYDKYTDEELERFAAARHISLKDAKNRKATIKLMFEADERRTFRFLDLPPELRSRVYVLHISHMPNVLFCPSLPPLARTCRLLRQEVPPVFCNIKTMRLRFERAALSFTKTSPNVRPTDQTSLWKVRAERNGMQNLTKVWVDLGTWWSKRDGSRGAETGCRITLGVGGPKGSSDEYNLKITGNMHEEEVQIGTKRRQMLEGLMRKILEKVAERDGKNKLTLRDLERLQDAMTATYE